MQKLVTDDVFQDLLEADKPHVFFFEADWCGDCQFIYPIMPELEKQFSQLTFIAVDYDYHMHLVDELAVVGIPSFIVTQSGTQVARLVNRKRKSQEEIAQFLSQALKNLKEN